MVQKNKRAIQPISRKPIRPIERQKMRAWLIDRLNGSDVQGLEWHVKSRGTFKISWRHAARQGWTTDRDADLFERWARHTGKYVPGDELDPKRWKANFRCALNSLPDVEELKAQSVRRGNNAYRIYQFCEEKKSKVRSRAESDEETTVSKSTRKMPARASRPKSYKHMEIDSESDCWDSSDSISTGSESPARTDISTISSDCESVTEEHCRIDTHELPDFEKICDKADYESLKPLLGREKSTFNLPSIDQLRQLVYLSILQGESSPKVEDEAASTTSSSMIDEAMDEDIVDLILDSENPESPETPSEVVDGYLNIIIGGEGVVDPFYHHEEEVVTSQTIILSETENVRAEQLYEPHKIEYTSLAVL